VETKIGLSRHLEAIASTRGILAMTSPTDTA